MKRIPLLFVLVFLVFSCKSEPERNIDSSQSQIHWEAYDETEEIEKQASHDNERMRFKLINSKYLDKNSIWAPFNEELSGFSEEKYEKLKPLILEKSIPELQRTISAGKLSYEELSLFYIYRIRKFESDNALSLNAVISLNPDVLEQARKLDKRGKLPVSEYSVYGMPILLKDNINTAKMPTTAGAIALVENTTSENAFIVDRLLDRKALILGKVNLSEWANYFCAGCPSGFSTVGGQTLNPYGRKQFDTGGSSSGSGVAVAANYAVAAVGTETAGSILSPSSKNSVVGLKPTLGLLSRTGIIPITGTLDTPGPMAKSVVDNAILLNALTGKDPDDEISVRNTTDYVKVLENAGLKGKRIGVVKPFLEDSLYVNAVKYLKDQGAEIFEFAPAEIPLDGFLTLLNADMKEDLASYLSTFASDEVEFEKAADIIAFNLQDSVLRAPYGQEYFKAVSADSTSEEALNRIKTQLQENGKKFFEVPMLKYQLDVVLSINNYHAAYAALARYPALTIPMGFEKTGEPKNVTFIARSFEEEKLFEIGYAFEKGYKSRKAPKKYN